jgi:hypothetical protein
MIPKLEPTRPSACLVPVSPVAISKRIKLLRRRHLLACTAVLVPALDAVTIDARQITSFRITAINSSLNGPQSDVCGQLMRPFRLLAKALSAATPCGRAASVGCGPCLAPRNVRKVCGKQGH